jgi:hypothetical protein
VAAKTLAGGQSPVYTGDGSSWFPCDPDSLPIVLKLRILSQSQGDVLVVRLVLLLLFVMF